MKPSIVVYGPQGCGKTINAERLKKHFGLSRIVDEGKEGRPLSKLALDANGVLYLCVDPLPEKKLNGAILMKYADAARLANLPETK